MMHEKSRRPSPLQRRVLIVLAALEERHPGTPVPTRLIERLLTDGGHGPVYGPNLRASCRRMEAAGWLRTLREKNMQLAVELTDAGRKLATPILAEEQASWPNSVPRKCGFCPWSRTARPVRLTILAGYTGQEVAEHLATVTVWNDDSAGRPS